MMRWFGKLLGMGLLILSGSVGIYLYQQRFSPQKEIARLEEEKRVLTRVVQRLSDEKRVARALVTRQQTIKGVLHSTVLFVENDRTGNSLPPKSFEIEGSEAHIDALVIKFEQDFIAKGDPLRGHSIALFTRIYGDQQPPSSAYPIDEPGKIPDVYRDSDPKITEFEMELWRNFWKLADNAQYRAEKGVRVANGQGVWGPFVPDKLYTITLESDGGLNITSEPVEGIFREALKRQAAENNR